MTEKGTQIVLPLRVAVARDVDGLEMGVLDDGRSYLTGRSLARLCGVVPTYGPQLARITTLPI